MSHKKRHSNKQKLPKVVVPTSKHCKISEVVDCIVVSVKSGWITLDELKQVVIEVEKKI